MNLETEILNLYKLIFEVYKAVDISMLLTYQRAKKRDLKKEEINLMVTPIYIVRTYLGTNLLLCEAPTQFKKELIEQTFNKKISEVKSEELVKEFLLKKEEADEVLKEITSHPATPSQESKHETMGVI